MDSVSFYENESTYKNNSALIGGTIYCTKCNITTLSNIYQYNIANEGGVIYIESDAQLSSRFDMFQSNTALSYGGAIFVSTRTIFKIYNSKFVGNYGTGDSAITAMKTSTATPFIISGC